ncbi:MAG: FecR domain-containing protein [Bacteriovorax sp.]|jgi:hypothetical protein
MKKEKKLLLKFKLFLFLLIFSHSLMAEVGIITKVIGGDAVIFRDDKTILVYQNTELEEGDRIETNNSVVLLQVYPGTQINLSAKSDFTIIEHDVEFEGVNEDSAITFGFLRGKLKILVDKLLDSDSTSQTIKTKTVALAVRGTEFEVEENDEGTSVDVTEGKVAAMTDEDTVELKKDESIQVLQNGAGRLAGKIKRNNKLIKHKWQVSFQDKEKIKGHWRERRKEQRDKVFRTDPATRSRLKEEKLKRREARLEKWKSAKGQRQQAQHGQKVQNLQQRKIEKIKELKQHAVERRRDRKN